MRPKISSTQARRLVQGLLNPHAAKIAAFNAANPPTVSRHHVSKRYFTRVPFDLRMTAQMLGAKAHQQRIELEIRERVKLEKVSLSEELDYSSGFGCRVIVIEWKSVSDL